MSIPNRSQASFAFQSIVAPASPPNKLMLGKKTTHLADLKIRPPKRYQSPTSKHQYVAGQENINVVRSWNGKESLLPKGEWNVITIFESSRVNISLDICVNIGHRDHQKQMSQTQPLMEMPRGGHPKILAVFVRNTNAACYIHGAPRLPQTLYKLKKSTRLQRKGRRER